MSAEPENKNENLLEQATLSEKRQSGEDSGLNNFSASSNQVLKQTFQIEHASNLTVENNSSQLSPTKIPVTFYNAPTEVIEPEVETTSAEQKAKSKESLLRLHDWRSAIVALAFLFAFTWSAIDIQQLFLRESTLGDWSFGWTNDRLLVDSVGLANADKLQVNDEILAINNEPVDKNDKTRPTGIFWQLRPGEECLLTIKRGNQIQVLRLLAQPLSFATVFNQYAFGVLGPLAFYAVGLLVFLFKPNDKKTFLLALAFAALGIMVAPKLGTYDVQLPPLFSFLWRSGIVLVHLAFPLFLHFHLIFPEPLNIVRRFPQIEWLIYLPFLFFVVPVIAVWQLLSAGWTAFQPLEETEIIGSITSLIVLLSLSASMAALLLNYLQTDETGKRRLRFLAIAIIFSTFPSLINYALASFVPFYNVRAPYFGVWQELLSSIPMLLLPFVYAYAIVRHKVLPISFIVRRGLQYLLAKNALRLLIVLPILGILWNIVSNQNRTLSDIFFRNSAAFYVLIILAAVLGLLIRFRLNDWIDKSFFRAQYNQERILRELIEAVRESDSLQKLSRLISSKIQMALHPKSIHLFFQSSTRNDYSLEYSSAGKLQDLKLSADCPLLQFMQKIDQSIDFSSPQIMNLPGRERAWLESLDANLLVPMRGSDERLIGFFSLGEKKSEIPYTKKDRDLLETLANQIAFVYENLTLKERVKREQAIKAHVLSRFEEGNINLLKECPVCGRCFDRIFEHCTDDNAELTLTLPIERTIENRYRLERLIGRGGMGTVYEATDLRLNRSAAVKILSNSSFGDQSALRRFEREARTVARLQHPNIVTVFDYGVLSTESAFLVMELVRGESLASIFKRQGPLDIETVAMWFSQILDGVEAAHKAAIIHRDLKPQNVLVVKNENQETRLCLLDFGLARITEQEAFMGASVTIPGTILGTFGYMPLEQLRGEKTDERSDLFAVGSMIYEALHGEIPFRAKNYHDLLQVMTKEIDLEPKTMFPQFFRRALARDPEKRFRSAGEMKNALLNLALN